MLTDGSVESEDFGAFVEFAAVVSVEGAFDEAAAGIFEQGVAVYAEQAACFVDGIAAGGGYLGFFKTHGGGGVRWLDGRWSRRSGRRLGGGGR